MLGPVPVVAARGVSRGEERAVTAVKCLDIGDVRIRDDDLAALRQDAQKRIVESMQDQRRNGDPIEHTRSGCPIIVVIRSGKAGIERGNAVVELSDRAYPNGSIRIVSVGKQRRLAPEPPKQGMQKLDLLKPVRRGVQRLSRRWKIPPRRDADDGTKLRRNCAAK